MNHPAVRDAALLILRVVLGVVFIAHGWDKAFLTGMNGPTGTIAQFERLGIPKAQMSAWGVAGWEMVGGALLLLGLLTSAVAGLMALFLAAAVYVANIDHGLFARNGGMELGLLCIAALIVVLVFGPGRASLDRALSRFS
ncbi:DoxX family protein [Corynebacterium heidelbergense]|uniref:DoxX family protein n=1 Tax=Corynebacterium heidelbergense TaxID=2055947 RepID=A0A364V9Z9_9CORY|nr:DoxX family protein [Corynebacterium heidelbergense]RAV33465.1 hypothetical protein CWC39_08325 [Corynebacterium heidelbergense]WCZ37124.1 Putative oxidoreductase CatD [Corynebacterium heidelbergense]